jgi:hypothetical protein
MEFAWRLTSILVWPVVVLTLLVLYRGWITSSLPKIANGRQIKKLKAGPVELEWESAVDQAGRNVAGVLAETAVLPTDDDPVPTNLVDLIPLAAANPRRGIRVAFHQVRRAVADVYPQLASVASDDLPGALRGLVRTGALNAEVEWAIANLYQLLEASDSGRVPIDPAYAYQFLSLAEGAIHAILRSARPPSVPRSPNLETELDEPLLSSHWRGTYNDSYPIELDIHRWEGREFQATMNYPGSGTTTQVRGRIEADRIPDGVTVVWSEVGYERRGGRAISFDGQYRTVVSSTDMDGAWYQGDRLVARLRMTAAADA